MTDEFTIPVLDHGFVKLRNIAGPTRRPDARFDADSIDPARCARISFDAEAETRPRAADLRLNRYLLKHNHCYHPSMEVLTVSGWKKWESLGETETFLVPDPITNRLNKETLPVLCFDFVGDLFTFSSKRMSYAVTPNHKMWFKRKYGITYEEVPVQDKANWGWFDPKTNYGAVALAGACDPEYAFIGFYLGDGCTASLNRLSFHIKKNRKKKYLLELLERLGLEYQIKQSSTYTDAVVFWVHTPEFLKSAVTLGERAIDKYYNLEQLQYLTPEQLRGLWHGLVNSDGHVPQDRQTRVEFSSGSPYMVKLFSALAAYFSLDAHITFVNPKTNVTHLAAYTSGRTSLESRLQYHNKSEYSGKVFCATTSTGLLMVRGNNREFGYVCGNSTPIEMIEVWMEMKLPIFVARQFVRHRTATLNEVSARYVELPSEWYLPNPEHVGFVTDSAKQGREIRPDQINPVADIYLDSLDHACRTAYKLYQGGISAGIPAEVARNLLHLNHYTHWIWKQDLWNLLGFLGKRLAPGAQFEAREYAAAIQKLLVRELPELMQAAEEFRKGE